MGFFVAGLVCFFGFLCGGGCLLQRDKYWRRVWEKSGQLDVHNIKELKQFIKKQNP